ncbi:MAG TPA: alpha/beta fold hydrolase [Chthoniobacterales bacterium]
MKLASWLLRMSCIPLLVYVGFTVLLAVFQNQFIYFPSRAEEKQLLREASSTGLEPWRDAGGAIIGWKSVRGGAAAANRMIVFHGNAGYAVYRSYFVEGFESIDAGKTWEVYLFEYPGYGARPGKPGEMVFNDAANAALRSLLGAGKKPVFLLGESIGAGVACHVASELPNEVAGLFLVTPFTTLPDVAAHHYPFLPVRMLLSERYDNVAALKKYDGPVAFLLAGSDEVIPVKFGRNLYDGYTGAKCLWTQENATHNTVDYDPRAPWWRDVSNFLLTRPSAATPE